MTDMPWAIILILAPLIGSLLCFLYPRATRLLGQSVALIQVIAIAGLVLQVFRYGTFRHPVGGWDAPLGIVLHADGLSLVMLVMTAVVGLAVSIYASAYFRQELSIRFWPIWLLLVAALNALFLSSDIFNLYVTVELMGLSAVALAALSGSKDALGGAMRYLLATLLGSLCYLFGVALLYHSFGSVDILTLSARIDDSPAVLASLGLITAGLLLKTALFPMHFWLPPAHASASAPVSAILSALVVKASFYILVRLWLELFEPVALKPSILLGLLGSIAVLWGSLQALRQSRLKLMVAYSTVAQVGYLFMCFPLATAAAASAWTAAVYLALAHAMAKSAMFMAAGNIMCFGGHDRIVDFDRIVQRLPLTAGAFALAGVSIMGLPPSGGFTGKWLLLELALAQGRWDLVCVLIVGGVLAAAYIFKVLGHAFTETDTPQQTGTVPASMEWSALLLAIVAVMLGFAAPLLIPMLDLGVPFGSVVWP